MKGMKYAGQVLGQTAIDIFEDPALYEKIKKEFDENYEEYVSPLKYDKVPIEL